jgi:peptidoglycan/LPS O-acetylase OafA/YrhL
MRLAFVPGRLPHLDGLRGVAAIVVVIAHLAAAFVPALYFGSQGRIVPQWQATFATWPSFVIINGSFAVFIFFVLSGFVISASADAAKSAIYKNCIARIIRLSVPCAASILLAGGLLDTGLNSWLADAARIVDHSWISGYVGGSSILHILREAVGSYYWKGGSFLNPPLWTMQRELLGSLAIYCVFGSIRQMQWRLCLCAFAVAVLIMSTLEAPYYLCFIAGTLLFVLRDNLRYFPSWSGVLMLIVGLFLGGRPYGEPPPESFYYVPFIIFGRHFYAYCWPVGATLIVTGTLVSSTAAKALGCKVGQFLGRISFGVYLVHFPLLKSIMAYFFVSWGQFGAFEFIISAFFYLCCVIIAGFIFTVLVDEQAIYLSHSVRRFHTSRLAIRLQN